MDDQPAIRNLIGKRDKVEFAQTITRYDRKFKGLKTAKRDLIVTNKGVFLIGREQVKDKKSPKLQLVAKASAIVASPCFKISRFFLTIHKC